MIKSTLIDRVLRDFSKVKLKKSAVKVPRLRIKKRNFTKQKQGQQIPNSSIINILIKAAVEKAKREKKEKAEEDKSYRIVKDNRPLAFNGGYRTASKSYGSARTSYVDYEKLFSYLGKFRARNPYENGDGHLDVLNKSAESSSFTLIDRETMDSGARFVRYMKHPTIEINKSSIVPVAGMSSAEWEQFKLWMMLDPVMYRFKTSTS